jgi:hypothetical protein
MKAPPNSRLFLTALLLLSIVLAGCGGSTTQGTITAITPSVTLTATPTQIAPGGFATLHWTSQNVSSVSASNFGATVVSGQKVVGPLNASTTFTITCTGTNGPASASATVTVSASAGTIPTGVLLYSIQQPSGGTKLFYQPASGGAPVQVGSYPAGVRVLATNPSGNRLLIAAPLANDPTNKATYLSDLDGVSNRVRMGTDQDTDAMDGAITVSGDVLVAWSSIPARTYSLNGVQTGSASYAFYGDHSVTVAPNPPGTVVYYNDQANSALLSATLPSFSNRQTVEGFGPAFNWVRVDPTGALIVYSVGTTISTANATSGAAATTVTTGSYPTFDNTASHIYFSKVGDGIYRHDLTTGSESRFVAIAGVWDGRIFWH